MSWDPFKDGSAVEVGTPDEFDPFKDGRAVEVKRGVLDVDPASFDSRNSLLSPESVSVADWLEREHGEPFSVSVKDYKPQAKSYGMTGNPESDFELIKHKEETIKARKAVEGERRLPRRKPEKTFDADDVAKRASDFYDEMRASGIPMSSSRADMSRTAQMGLAFGYVSLRPFTKAHPWAEDTVANSKNKFVAVPAHMKDRFIGSASRMLVDAVKMASMVSTRLQEDDFLSGMMGRDLAGKFSDFIDPDGHMNRSGQGVDERTPLEDDPTYQVAKGLEAAVDIVFAGNREMEESFALTTVPDVMGSFASYMALGLLTGGQSTAVQSAGFIAGVKSFLIRLATNPATYAAASSQSIRAYEEAGLYGLEEAERRLSMAKAAPSGVVQVLNVTRILGRWDKAFQGKISNNFVRMLKEATVGGFNEAFVEGAGEGMYNVGVRTAWDDDARFLDNTFDSAIAGGTGGAIMGFIMEGLRASAMRGRGAGNWKKLNQSQRAMVGLKRAIEEIGVNEWDSMSPAERMKAVSGSIALFDKNEGREGDAYLQLAFDRSEVTEEEKNRKPEPREKIDPEMTRADEVETEMPASVAAMEKFLNPETGQTDVDWQAVKENFDDADLQAYAVSAFGDAELGQLLIDARDGSEEARAAVYERTTEVIPEVEREAGLSREEADAMAQSEASQSVKERTFEEIRKNALDWAIQFRGDRLLDGQSIEDLTDTAFSFEDDLNALRDQGVPEWQIEKFAFEVIKAAGRDPFDTRNAPSSTPIAGRNEAQFRRGVWQYVSKLFRDANPLTVFHEVSEGNLKQLIEKGELDWFTVATWREMMGDGPNANQVDLSSPLEQRKLTEWTSGQVEAWLVSKTNNMEREGLMPETFRQWLAAVFLEIRHIFRRAAQLKGMDRRGELDPQFKEFLERSNGLDENFLRERLERPQQMESASDIEINLLDVVPLNRLPRPDMEPEYRGELEQIFEAFGKNWKSYPKTATTLDEVAAKLREEGFEMQTPADVIDAYMAVSRGESVVNATNFVDTPSYSLGRMPVDFAKVLEDALGHEGLTQEQPSISVAEKRQMLFDFSEAVSRQAEGELASGRGNNSGRPGSLRIAAQKFQEGLARDYKVDFLGAEIRDDTDLAIHAQSLRNPLFETFYYFAVKDGKLVDVSAISGRIPFSAKIVPDGNGIDWVSNKIKGWKDRGVNQIYLLHNHPSGDTYPSGADVKVTGVIGRAVEAGGVDFGGHIIINHKEFRVLDGANVGVKKMLSLNPGPDPILGAASVTPFPGVLNQVIDGPEKVVDFAKQLEANLEARNDEIMTVFIVGRKNDVRGAFHISEQELLDPANTSEFKEMVRSQGGAMFAIYGETSREQVEEKLYRYKDFLRNAKAIDVVIQAKDSAVFESGHSMGMHSDPGLDYFMGEKYKALEIQNSGPTYSLALISDLGGNPAQMQTARERTPEERILAQKLREFRTDTWLTQEQKNRINKTPADGRAKLRKEFEKDFKRELKILQTKATESRKRQRLQQSAERKIAAFEAKRLAAIKEAHERGEDVTAKLEELDRIRKDLPTAVRHRLGGDVQVSRRKTRMGRQNEVNRRIVRARELAEGHEATRRRAWLARTLNRYGNRSGLKLQGLSKEVTKDVRDRLRVAIYAANHDRAEDVIQRMAKPEGMSQRVFEETARDFVGLLQAHNRDYARIEAAYFAVQDLIREGRYSMEQFRDQRKARLDELALNATRQALRGEGLLNDSEIARRDEGRGPAGVAGRWLSNQMSGMVDGFENILRRIDGELEGALWRDLFADPVDGIAASQDRVNTYVQEAADMLLDGLAEAFPELTTKSGKPNVSAITKRLTEWERHPKKGERTGIEMSDREGGEVADRPLSIAEAITVKLLLRQEGSHPTFHIQHGVDDVATFERAVDAYIGPDALAFVDNVISPFYDGAFNQLNEVHKRVEGYELDPVKDYFPFLREIASENVEDAGNPFAPFSESGSRDGVDRSSLETRSKMVTLPFRFQSVTSVLQNSVRTNANYIGKAGLEKKFRRLTSDPNFKRALKQRFGSKAIKQFVDAANVFVAGRMQQSAWGGWLDAARSRMITGVLAAKPKIMLTQLTSIPAGAVDMPVADWVSGVANIMRSPERHFRELLNTPQMRHRISQAQAQETITSLNKLQSLGLGAGWGARMEQAIKYSMILIKVGDVAGASLSAGPVYFRAKERELRAGKTEAHARQIASHEFAMAVNRSQQSPHLHSRPQAYQQGEFLRALYAFRSAPIQYQSEVNRAVSEFVRTSLNKNQSKSKRWEVAKQSGKAFFVYHILLPQLFYAVNNALTGFWLDDDDRVLDYWKGVGLTFLMGNFAAVPVAGDVVYSTAAKFTDTSAFSPTVAPIGAEMISRLPVWMDHLFTGDAEQRVKAASRMANFTGLPAETITRQAQAFGELMDEGDPTKFLEMMGWSEFIFGNQ